MSDVLGQILGVVAVLAIFTAIIMGSIYPAIKDNGENLENEVRNTSYGYIMHMESETVQV